MHEIQIITASLGPSIAAVTCHIQGGAVAVVNTTAAHDPVMRAQAVFALLGLGVDSGTALGALNGVRS